MFRFSANFILLLIAICVSHAAACLGQPLAGFGIETNAIAGKVYKHEKKFTLPIPALTTGLDINLLQHTHGKKAWEQRRKYPTIGIGFAYINYGIDSVYGHCFGLYPNLTIPLVSGKKLEWTLRMGDGIGYVTKEFRRTPPVDTINVAIGSHINGFTMFMSDLRYHINQHWDMQLGANITHISNSSYHKPNLGINMTGAHLGACYYPVMAKPAHIVRNPEPLKNRWLVQARLSMAYISSYTPGGPLYPVYITSGYVSRRWISKNKMFAGLDYAYYQSIYAYLRNNEIDPGHEKQNSWKSAVFAGNEFLLGRVGIVLQVGYYLRESALKTAPVYEKIGGHYYFVQKESGPIKEFFLSAFLKTHETVAELGEVGLGFGF
ncbi:MAG: acyloxyacyl hydrolase [Chitinophagales bacterium]